MAYYRLYFLNSARRVAHVHELDCDTDDDACERARMIGKGQHWELWSGTRRIQCSHGGGQPETMRLPVS